MPEASLAVEDFAVPFFEKHARMLPSAFRQKFLSAPGLLRLPILIAPTSLADACHPPSFCRASAALRGSSSAAPASEVQYAPAITASAKIHRVSCFIWCSWFCGCAGDTGAPARITAGWVG